MENHKQKHRMLLKPFTHVRPHTVPGPSVCIKDTVSEIRSRDSGRLIQLSGTVVRAGEVRMRVVSEDYECGSCGFQFRVDSDLEDNNSLTVAKMCPAPATGRKKCLGRTMKYVDNTRVCQDYQELRIQEQVQKLSIGSIPRSIKVVLTNDLVDASLAGDDVTIVGIVRRMWDTLYRDQPVQLELFVEALHVVVPDDNKKTKLKLGSSAQEHIIEHWKQFADRPIFGRDQILKSMCPQLYGLRQLKLCLAVTLMGGVTRVENGTRIRGESHLLLVGDPGTGKSQLLKYATKLVPRSVLTTGVGTTSAGLTCAAVRDTGHWTLEAGALVLSDGGVCCIDEFGSIRAHDRASIHEAMEQQTISVAKAGLVCTLQTRTTVLAAMNPKGAYDAEADLSVNCAIASPLLSRFDLILLLLDTKDTQWDARVCAHIMDSLEAPAGEGGGKTQSSAVETPHKPTSSTHSSPDPHGWSLERLQAYIAYAKSIDPLLSPSSQRIIKAYFQLQRRSDDRNQARTTIRLLESLIRIAQGHARLMFRPRVLASDALAAVILVEASMAAAGSGDSVVRGAAGGGVLHSDFPADPDATFDDRARSVLDTLGIEQIPDEDYFYDYSDLEARLHDMAVSHHPAPSVISTPAKQTGPGPTQSANGHCSSEFDRWPPESGSVVNHAPDSGAKPAPCMDICSLRDLMRETSTDGTVSGGGRQPTGVSEGDKRKDSLGRRLASSLENIRKFGKAARRSTSQGDDSSDIISELSQYKLHAKSKPNSAQSTQQSNSPNISLESSRRRQCSHREEPKKAKGTQNRSGDSEFARPQVRSNHLPQSRRRVQLSASQRIVGSSQSKVSRPSSQTSNSVRRVNENSQSDFQVHVSQGGHLPVALSQSGQQLARDHQSISVLKDSSPAAVSLENDPRSAIGSQGHQHSLSSSQIRKYTGTLSHNSHNESVIASMGGHQSTTDHDAVTVSSGGHQSATVSQGCHQSAIVSSGGHQSTTVSSGGHQSATVPPGGHQSATVSQGGHQSTTVSPGGQQSVDELDDINGSSESTSWSQLSVFSQQRRKSERRRMKDRLGSHASKRLSQTNSNRLGTFSVHQNSERVRNNHNPTLNQISTNVLSARNEPSVFSKPSGSSKQSCSSKQSSSSKQPGPSKPVISSKPVSQTQCLAAPGDNIDCLNDDVLLASQG
eukprot:732393_1